MRHFGVFLVWPSRFSRALGAPTGRSASFVLALALSALFAVLPEAEGGDPGGPQPCSPGPKTTCPTSPPSPPPPRAWAEAGNNQTVNERSAVQLIGSGNGTFSWRQLSGPRVRLSNAAIANPSFTAPDVGADQDLEFQLWVTHHRGTGGSAVITHDWDTVTITVRAVDTGEASGEASQLVRTVAGRVPGTLSVDPTGAASYRIPIAVPPGTAGVEPSLSLSYSSSAGAGVAGLGWSLDGLSSIDRCRRTKAQDNVRGTIAYASTDRFCLDGQRLVAVRGAYGADGAEYRTEIDTFVKVISRGDAGGGPEYFEAWTKSGQKMEYGRTADSRVEAVGASAVRQWALNRVEDTLGNYLTVRYLEFADGQAYPSRIDYTGYRNGTQTQATHSSVRFAYRDRPDARVFYQGGRRVRLSKRLAAIRTYAGSTLASDYRLSYLPSSPSRLSGVMRCDGAGDCMPATEFLWGGVGSGEFGVAQSTRTRDLRIVAGNRFEDHHFVVTGGDGSYRTESSPYYAPIVAGDFNGDGITTSATTVALGAGLSVSTKFGTGTVSSSPRASGNFRGYESQTGDFNGDGRTDIVWTREYGGFNSYVSLSAGAGRFGAALYSKPKSGNLSHYRPLVGDFNGDGISDLVWNRSNYGLESQVTLGDGSGRFRTAQYSKPKSGSFAGYQPLVGDFNGDGISDVLWEKASNGSLKTYVALGKGDGTLAAAAESSLGSLGTDYRNHEAMGGDFNGDGLADVAWVRTSTTGLTAYIALGNGDGTFVAAKHSFARPSRVRAATPAVAADFGGDGVTDVAWWVWKGETRSVSTRVAGCTPHYRFGGVYEDCQRTTAYNVWREYRLSGLGASNPGRVVSVSSATGSTLRLSYARLTDATRITEGTVYVKDGGSDRCTYPCLDLKAPMYVVREVARDHGLGQTHRMTYRYGGAKVDLNGRGFLGFRWMESLDLGTGVRSKTYYKQAFPYIGRVASNSSEVLRRASGGYHLTRPSRLSSETNTWSSKSLNGGKTRYPYVSRSVANTYEPEDGANNTAVTAVTTTGTYDDYGNPTRLAVRTVGAGGTFTKTVSNTYRNSAANWRLGRLACAKVQHAAPGRAARTRTSGFAYSATTGLLTKEVVEPRAGDVTGATCVSSAAGSGATLVTAYEHDRYGNRTRTTVSGPGGASRSTAVDWGSCGRSAASPDGRFPLRTTNALGHREQRLHSPLHGAAQRLRGPNGLETAREYDGFGRLVRERRPDGTRTSMEYALCSGGALACPRGAVQAVIEQRTGSGETVRYLDRRGLALRVETEGFDGGTVRQDTEYDALGRVSRASRPYAASARASSVKWTRYAYDALGRVTQETRPDGSRTKRVYDGLVTAAGSGRLIQEQAWVYAPRVTADAQARKEKRRTDALGRLLEAVDAAGNRVKYAYDALGNMVSATDAGGHVRTMAYSVRGWKTSMTDPDMGTWRYTYNGLGEALTQTDAKGQAVTNTYDLLGRKLTRTEAEGTTRWIWDAAAMGKGKLARVEAPGGYARSHAYDSYGRPSGETTTLRVAAGLPSPAELDGTDLPSGPVTPDVARLVPPGLGQPEGGLGGGALPGAALLPGTSLPPAPPATETFAVRRTYDAAGRVSTIVYPGPSFSVAREYTASGQLKRVRDGTTASKAYWTAVRANAAGQVTEALLGNGMRETRTYDANTGALLTLQSGPGRTATVQDLGYTYDHFGNLTAREDFRADVYETFSYDAAHRLTKAELHAEADDRKLASKSYSYSAAGNILTKSDTGAAAYAYGAGNAAGPGNAGPHAVVSAGGSRYAYDDNGNMTSGAGRTIAWTSFNKPWFIARAATGPSPSLADMLRVEFEYGPERRRTRQRRTQGAVDTEITYIGTLYERETRTGAATRHVRYVFAGGRRVALVQREEGGPPPAERPRYLHADHLGSVDVVTNGTGTVLERLSYDAFGARRTAAGASAWRDSAVSITPARTARGYTGHEHLDVFGLVHMNGRVYDPQLGRFLSADPHVQALGSTQALNRYSYVMNNPLSYTDPSGYFFKSIFRGVKRAFKKIFRNKVVRVAGAMAFAYWGGSWGANLLFNTKNALAASAVGGFGAGFIASGGNLRAAFVGGLTGAGFGHIGAQSWDFAHKVLAHGAVGGAGAELSGGKFGAGFVGSAFTKLASPQIAAVSSNDIAGAVTAAVVGGTASELAGGKFGNGAMSGAFAYLYNELSIRKRPVSIFGYKIPNASDNRAEHLSIAYEDESGVVHVISAGPDKDNILLKRMLVGRVGEKGYRSSDGIDVTTFVATINLTGGMSEQQAFQQITNFISNNNRDPLVYNNWNAPNSNTIVRSAVDNLGATADIDWTQFRGAETTIEHCRSSDSC